MTVVCITNEMPDFRSCTVKGEHLRICDGFEYAWNPKRQREEATGRECRGCLPREAKKGLLCWSCWDRVQHAMTEWTPWIERILLTIDRAVQSDNGGIRSDALGHINIAATRLAVDEVRSYLRSCTGTAEAWVSAEAGAMDAVRFARAASSAVRTHELEEKTHRIQRVRCPKCRHLSLAWTPPYARPPFPFSPDVTVSCQNPSCGHRIDQSVFEALAKIERAG